MTKIRSTEPPATTRADDDVEALRRQVARLVRENEKQQRRLDFLIRLVALLRSGGVDLATRSRLVQDNQQFGVRWLCQVLRLDRRHLYHWRRDREEHGRRVAADEQLAQLITKIHAGSGGTYGAARITAALHRQGLVVNRKRVARIMRERGIRGVTRRRRRSLTRPDRAASPAPDLLRREFTAHAPGLRIVGDITCVPTGEGWVYLAVLLDLCTREIIGWATAARHNATLVIRALHAAIRNGYLANGAILHSDRGSEYTSAAYRHEIARIGARQSLSRSGSCLDNAPAEAFFATLKAEIGRACLTTRKAAVDSIDHWIGLFYNTRRLHSTIGYRAPTEARLQHHSQTAIAASPIMTGY